MKINILTKGFLSPTSRGWLHPLVKNKSMLLDMGINLNFYFKYSDEVRFCDVVIVESRFVYKDWRANKSKIFELLTNLKTKNNKVFYYDLGDSTYSWALEALPYVDKLLKPFIFKDKNNYCVPLNGFTIITDYYYNKGMIGSYKPLPHKDLPQSPIFLENKDKHLLEKIQLGYNSTFADNSSRSNLWKYSYYNRIARRFFKIYSSMLKTNKSFDYVNPEVLRSKDLSCRILLEGYSNGIDFHRKETAKILSKYISTDKLSREDYFAEMQNSKVVVSPFGWGEINVPRDYEVALSGSVLLKPDISHIDTWPNIFNKDTVVQYKWDLSNLLELVEKIINNHDDYIDFAIRLQDQYKYYSFGRIGQEKFCEYFSNMIKN
ncbi:hypothetical protein N9369_01195 [Candidatus Pelagibacter sp.]|nr:hypothetical protein [Candidatus Pelagibacter sp.]